MKSISLAISAYLIFAFSLGSVTWAQEKKEPRDQESTADQQAEKEEPASLKQKASYLIGYNIIKDMQAQEIEVDIKALLRGINDANNGKKPPMSAEEIQSVQQAFQRMIVRQQQERMAKAADENMRKGTAFLRENAMKEGVKEMENGLQYEVLESGEGDSPTITDTVKIRFTGKYLDGTVFDSSGESPASMTVAGGPLRGINVALQKMKVGSKWKLYLPPELAYGVQGNPPIVGPNQVVIYEVELLEIVE